MQLFKKFAAVGAVVACATAGTGAATADAQVMTRDAVCSRGFAYITGDGVRFRKSPGGTVLGLTWWGTAVDVMGSHVGQWEQVGFLIPPLPGLHVAWVSDRYVAQCRK
ncbi:hypothetical protein ACFQ1S_28420 [Kibdelosporangium lantanae]|uniref:SH3 domain-containing protein n=1 Tax=Kibdelosporangium lantanae TaxID=1497396 RepID=A0ABW3MFT1_9PSEU